ncbi:MAG: phosphoribosylpyrophosphate synthetase [Bacteroidota bacterium]|nr:phosphoribosylpyrophosphate synthetase [Bacteroidota bacterium]MDP4217640.1 phosphoribosylpyrophosphate synthetase [Bacteroidota bacterium]MDP4255926.1 phosphoribosylpyrophosphate synthetase [Bacteroidota bacterium]MDP4257327.1 phosphoribosylpyrophosphate synthetase [Bacteroidota bacterium]
MFAYDTLTEAINGLKQRGYTLDFNLGADQITCHAHSVSLRPDEFEITEVHRFEGDSNPDDEAVVYAIESKHGHRGVLVNGFGISSDALGEEMVSRLSFKH